VTPSTPNPKRSKSKPKVEAAPKKEPAKKTAVSAPVKTKKARIAPSTAAVPAPIEIVATAVEVVNTSALSVTDLQQQIEIAAYFLAEQRNFSPGNELDDWLQAERQVREARTT
jgi:Protein of unknown function (DUF2934)